MLGFSDSSSQVTVNLKSFFYRFKERYPIAFPFILGAGVLVLVGVGSVILKFSYSRSFAQEPGPNVPILYGVDLAGNLAEQELRQTSVQRDLLANIKERFKKTDWNLDQIQLIDDPVYPVEPERALFRFPQVITNPDGSTAEVEGGSIGMLINAIGASDDTVGSSAISSSIGNSARGADTRTGSGETAATASWRFCLRHLIRAY